MASRDVSTHRSKANAHGKQAVRLTSTAWQNSTPTPSTLGPLLYTFVAMQPELPPTLGFEGFAHLSLAGMATPSAEDCPQAPEDRTSWDWSFLGSGFRWVCPETRNLQPFSLNPKHF